MRFNQRVLLGLLSPLAACSDGPISVAPASMSARTSDVAPLVRPTGPAVELVPDQYIVVFDASVLNADQYIGVLAQAHAFQTRMRFHGKPWQGFVAILPPNVVETLRRDPRVSYIEQDQWAEYAGIYATSSWALDRIDQRILPLDGFYSDGHDPDPFQTESAVNVYVIDSGIDTTHSEFGGRAHPYADVYGQNSAVPCNPHGTGMASIIGGNTVGVAKRARLYSVKVGDSTADCGISVAALILGIRFVVNNHVKPAVISMSIDLSSRNSLVDAAALDAYNAGVFFVHAAGNYSGDACDYSPSNVPQAFTVAAMRRDGSREPTSNVGQCVDIFAPGDSVRGAYPGGAYGRFNQTSAATAIVAGVAAHRLEYKPNETPFQVGNAIATNASSGVVSNAGTGTPNRLVYNIYPITLSIQGPDSVQSGVWFEFYARPFGGVPPYTYTWKKNDIIVDNDGYYATSDTEGYFLELEIRDQRNSYAYRFKQVDVYSPSCTPVPCPQFADP